MDRMGEAVAFLDRDVARRRASLLRTLHWEASAQRPSTGKHRTFVR
jgi:deoxyhypusine synthase